MSYAIHGKVLEKAFSLPTLFQAIESNGVIELTQKPDGDLFEYLAKTVSGQQLSKAAATTIWSRVKLAAAKLDSDISGFCISDNYEELRKCGLSNAKVKAIIGLNDAVIRNLIPKEIYTTNDTFFIRDQLTKLWGIGEWSADIMTLSFFGKPDVWLGNDVALQRGVKIISESDSVSPDEIVKHFTPYRSFLSLHLWKALDSNLI